MSKTLLDGIYFLRTSILDDTGGTGVDWTTVNEGSADAHQFRWSNEELSLFIDQAWKQVARRTLCYKDTDTFKQVVKAGDSGLYTMDSRILKVIDLESTTSLKPLIEVDINYIMGIKDWRNQSGYLKHWIPEYHEKVLRVWPKPLYDDVLLYTVYRLPLFDLTWDNPDQVVTIRDEWFYDMLNYAAGLAYLKDEANSKDEPRSAMFMQKFNEQFSDTSAYAESRKHKTAHREIKYGGIKGNDWFPAGYRSYYR